MQLQVWRYDMYSKAHRHAGNIAMGEALCIKWLV